MPNACTRCGQAGHNARTCPAPKPARHLLCSKCGRRRKRDDFPPWSAMCRDCVRSYNRAYRAQRRAQRKAS